MPNVSLLPLHTWRWWHRPLIGRFGLRTADGRLCGYAQGIRSAFRIGPLVLTRYADCTCDRTEGDA